MHFDFTHALRQGTLQPRCIAKCGIDIGALLYHSSRRGRTAFLHRSPGWCPRGWQGRGARATAPPAAQLLNCCPPRLFLSLQPIHCSFPNLQVSVFMPFKHSFAIQFFSAELLEGLKTDNDRRRTTSRLMYCLEDNLNQLIMGDRLQAG